MKSEYGRSDQCALFMLNIFFNGLLLPKDLAFPNSLRCWVFYFDCVCERFIEKIVNL